MPFDLKQARADGYSDDEIADFLAPQYKLDLARARKDGYTGTEIVEQLATMAPKPPPAPLTPDQAEGGEFGILRDQAQNTKPAEPLAQPLGESVSSASKEGTYRFGAGLLDSFWAMGQSAERKLTEGPQASDVAASAVPGVGPLVEGLQHAARLLAPKDEAGRVQRTELAQKLEDAADAMAPELAKESFDDAWAKGHTLEWMVVQAAEQSPQVATLLATILFPPAAPATLPAMGLSAAGNQYAENVKAGVPQDRAALDSAVNGLTELASEAVGYKIGAVSGKVFDRILSRFPEAERAAAASSILARVAAATGTIAGGGVLEGTSEAAGQVVQDLSQEHIAGRPAGDIGENARTAFFASLLPGAIFAAPHTLAHATHTASTIPLEGKGLDDQIKDVLTAPITEIAAVPAKAETIDSPADVGLSTETVPTSSGFDFDKTFPSPTKEGAIAPDQLERVHREVIDLLRASHEKGETETFGHVIDAYRQMFGPEAATQLDQFIKGGDDAGDVRGDQGLDRETQASPGGAVGASLERGEDVSGADLQREASGGSSAGNAQIVGGEDERSRAQPIEGASQAERAAGPATAGPENAASAEILKSDATRPVETGARPGGRADVAAGATNHGGGAPRTANVQRQGQAETERRDLERAKDERDQDQARIKDFTTRRGEVKTFPTSKQAALYAKQKTNRVPSNYTPREIGPKEWVLSAPVRERTEAQRANDRRLSAERARVDPAKDSLATIIGKLGGINADELLRDGVDRASLKDFRSGVVGKPAYRTKGGLSLDALAELVEEHGFDVRDDHGQIDASKLRELIQQELDGTRVFTPEGYERQASLADEQKQREEQHRVEHDFTPDELQRAGYDELSDDGKEAVTQIFDEDADEDLDALWDGKGKVLTDEEADRLFGPAPTAAGSASGREGESPHDREAAATDQGRAPGEVTPSQTPPIGGVSASTAPEHAHNQGKPLDTSTKYEPTAAGAPPTAQGSLETDHGISLLTMSEEAFKEVTDEWAEIIRAQQQRVITDKRAGAFLPIKEAQKRVDEWKAHAKAQRKDPRTFSINSGKTILSLFDYTGEWSKPWAEAGYNVLMFDIQHDKELGDVHNFSVEFFNENFDISDVDGILAACPCTDFAVSGARHFAGKDADGRTEASKELVFQTLRTIEYFRPRFWVLENPVGRIEKLTGIPPARMTFDPHHFGAPYTKKTMLWGKFNAELPTANVEPTEGSKMWALYGGKSQATKNARSETPEGFAYAFFMANNYADLSPEQRLAGDYPEASGAVRAALKAGVTEDEIRALMEDTYDNLDYEQARTELMRAAAARGAEPRARYEVRQPTRQYAGGSQPTVFSSGLSRTRDFKAALAAGAPVGIEIGEISDAGMKELADAIAGSTTPIFVDSGAFSLFRANLRRGTDQFTFEDFGQGGKAMDFEKIFDRYDQLLRAASKADEANGGASPHLFSMVMPDVVGNQAASLDLLREHKDEVEGYLDRGGLIPLQAGDLSLTEVFDEIAGIFGRGDFSVAIPSNEKAAPLDQVRDLLRERGDQIAGVHFLGAAAAKNLDPRMAIVRETGFDGDVSADANLLRGKLYGSSDRAEALRKAVGGTGVQGRDREEVSATRNSGRSRRSALARGAWASSRNADRHRVGLRAPRIEGSGPHPIR
jgi:hypothetical protein